MSLSIREWTPRGRGAVSVVRLSGTRALETARALSGRADFAPSTPQLVRVSLDGEDLDHAIVCALSPFEVELHLHGSPILVRRLLDRLGEDPHPTPAPSSIEERAASSLAQAPCEAAARILLDQAEGALSRELRSLPDLEESQRRRSIDLLLDRWRTARRSIEPAEVVIAGPPNAGKSTLFNALLGERRAIVTPEPGTTRDPLRERALLGAWPAWLVDTAGERNPLAGMEAARVEEASVEEAAVEAEGQARGRRARDGADLVLWLEPLARSGAPAGRPSGVPPVDGRAAYERISFITTFADRRAAGAPVPGAISALRDPGGARERVAEVFRSELGLPSDPWLPGAAVPFTSELAAAIGKLRPRRGTDLVSAVEALLEGHVPEA